MKNISTVLNKFIESKKYQGIEWIIKHKENKYSGSLGYLNLENKIKLKENSIYRIWSMTKPIVAVAAMQLIENEQMSLDDPINKYLPEFSNLKVLKDEENISITTILKKLPTIKDLFLHTAGFSYNFLASSALSKRIFTTPKEFEQI